MNCVRLNEQSDFRIHVNKVGRLNHPFEAFDVNYYLVMDFIRIKAHILGKSSVAGTTKSAGEPVASVVNAETVETEPQNTEQYIDSDTETMYYLNVEKFYLPEVKYSSGSYLNK